MANIFQKMFLSKNKIVEMDKHNEIIKFVKSGPKVSHFAEMTETGGVVRRFIVATDNIRHNDYVISAERIFDPAQANKSQIQYRLCIRQSNQPKYTYATHSEIDKFAERVYKQMYKIWDKQRQHAK